MNPISKIASEQIAEGNTVISVFSDSSTAGIIVRLKDGKDVPYVIEGSDPSENQRWASEAGVWLSKAYQSPF